MEALEKIETVVAEHGETEHVFRWASVTKLLTASAVLVAAEEGIVDLEEGAGPAGATVRHLLAHASGLPFEGEEPIARPGERRIYSNTGFELLGALLAERAQMPFAEYLREAILQPLGMTGTKLEGSSAAGLTGPLADLLLFARELLAPSFVATETFAEATTVVFPGLAGVLPGIGRQEPLDWGLGFELRDGKTPHWTGSRNSAGAFCPLRGGGGLLLGGPQ